MSRRNTLVDDSIVINNILQWVEEPPFSRGVEKPEGPSALQPTTESVIQK